MKVEGGKFRLIGSLEVPGDKSISHRAVILGSIAEEKTIIENFLMAEDCLATVKCFRDMGVVIEIDNNRVMIEGVGLYGLRQPNKELYVGNSGTSIRLISGILSGQGFPSVITGDASILKRPMDRIIKPLQQMGASIKGIYNRYPPLEIEPSKGLSGITYKQPIASAQVKSCLLLAGLYADGRTCITEPNRSRDHTERMLDFFGGSIKRQGTIITLEACSPLLGKTVIVPGDISSAAFFIVAALILEGSELVIKEVGLNKTRSGMIEVLRAMGGDIKIFNRRTVNNEDIGDIAVRHSRLKGIEIKGDIIPRLIDEIPILAVAAATAEGSTIINNAEELKYKESNRIDTMVNQMTKMNIHAKSLEDGMVVYGGNPIRGSRLHTHNDHRIAMALSILALYANGDSEIDNSECINISFPTFYELLKSVIDKR